MRSQDREGRRTFDVREVGLRDAIDSLMVWYGVSLVYLDKDLEGRQVSASCRACTVEEALGVLLRGMELQWIRRGNQIVLRRTRAEVQPRTFTVSGSVRDSLTGDALVGATVLLLEDPSATNPKRWCPTNAFGFFSLRNIPDGRYTLVVRALGYRPVEVAASVSGGSLEQDITMIPEEIMLHEVTIEGQRTTLTAAEGISRGVFIRTTPSDHTQYLLEGARVYNPSHYGGVLTTFNPEALNDIHVRLGGMPPYYGGRIGGIFDVSMREGTPERFSGSAGIGSLSSHLNLEGPVSDRTTFMISGRKGYPDVVLPRLDPAGTPSSQNSSELIAKFSHRLSPADRLSLSGYIGRDSYNNNPRTEGMSLQNDLSWGNATATLRWMGITSPSLFMYASAGYTRYDFDVRHMLQDDQLLLRAPMNSDFLVEDVSLRAHAEHYYDEEHTVLAGVELIHHRMDGLIHEFSSQLAPLSLRGTSVWELSAYVQDQWRLLPRVTAEVGARATSLVAKEGSFSGIDPRFSLLFTPADDLRLYTSFTSINQYVHPYRNSGIFLFYPTIFWYPSTESVKPSTSLQVSVGGEHRIDRGAYLVTGETYFRVTENLHEFVYDSMLPTDRDLRDVALSGTGRAYGFELALQKRTGSLKGTVKYHFSWETHRFEELNDGKPYRARFDRRHEIQLATWYTPAEDWQVGVFCVLAADQSPSFAPKVEVRVSIDPGELVDVNGSRLPGFQRIEIRLQRRFSLGRYPVLAFVRLMNGYGLLDPFRWDLWSDRDTRLTWSARLEQPGLLPLYPTVGLTLRF